MKHSLIKLYNVVLVILIPGTHVNRPHHKQLMVNRLTHQKLFKCRLEIHHSHTEEVEEANSHT